MSERKQTLGNQLLHTDESSSIPQVDTVKQDFVQLIDKIDQYKRRTNDPQCRYWASQAITAVEAGFNNMEKFLSIAQTELTNSSRREQTPSYVNQ